MLNTLDCAFTIDRKSKAMRELKTGKAPALDGTITAQMLKYGGEIVVDWMVWMCKLAWQQSKVPEDWRRAIIVPLYKGKGKRGNVIIIGV